jgi:hypothetical protein
MGVKYIAPGPRQFSRVGSFKDHAQMFFAAGDEIRRVVRELGTGGGKKLNSSRCSEAMVVLSDE